LAREPNNPAALVERVQCARRLGDSAEARRLAEAALDAPLDREQRAAVLTALAQTYLDERQPEQALSLLTEAVQLAPAESSIHHALGIAHSLAGDAKRAQAHRERANEIREQYNRLTEITIKLLEAPQRADLRTEAGLILMGQGMEDEGAQWLRTAVDCDPQHRPAHEALATYYARRGDPQQAARHRLMASRDAGPQKD
jgi:Tfp pilus assembly protein PilF